MQNNLSRINSYSSLIIFIEKKNKKNKTKQTNPLLFEATDKSWSPYYVFVPSWQIQYLVLLPLKLALKICLVTKEYLASEELFVQSSGLDYSYAA